MDLMTFDIRSLFRKNAPAPKAPEPDLMSFDPASLTKPKDADVKSIISGAAKRYGVPDDLLHNIAGAESTGRANAASKSSSAKGLFQFIDSTWQAMGGRPGEQFDPEKNADLGAKYVSQNINTLRGALGRDPSYGEVYAAHHFGPGVHRMLSGARPDARIEAGLATFNNPGKVRQIMAQNPHLRGKTVSQVLEALNQKAGAKFVPGEKRAEADNIDAADAQLAQADVSYEDAWSDDELGRQVA